MRRIGRPHRAALLLAIGAAGGGAAFAVASVPDSSGVIHACYQVTTVQGTTAPATNPGNLRVIDPSAGQSCNTVGVGAPREATLNWNTIGAQGPPGPRGGLTISTPPIRSHAPSIGQVTLGSGRNAVSFDLLELALGATQGSTSGHGAKAGIHDLQITKRMDKASPLLLKALTGGEHFAGGIIVVKSALRYDLTDVIVTSDQVASGGARPTESITLNFTKLTIHTIHTKHK